MGNRHKVIQKLTKPQQEKLLVDIQTGATNYHKASREIGIADISIKRWFMSIPEDEKLRLVAQHLERAPPCRDGAGGGGRHEPGRRCGD